MRNLVLYNSLIMLTTMRVATVLVNVPLISGFQRLVDEKVKSKFFAMLSFSGSLLISVGNVLVGVMLNIVLVGSILIIFSIISIIFTVITFRSEMKGL